MLRTMILDWRGVPNLSKPADLYSVANTHRSRPVLGNPDARVLVGISPTLLYHDTDPATTPFNLALYEAAKAHGALTDRVVWNGTSGWHTRLIDLTKRGMAQDYIKLALSHFAWADGFHHDYFSAWSWQFPDLAPADAAWDNILAGVANEFRHAGKLCVGQQFHLTPPVMATNGCFVEGSPFAFRYSLDGHAEDLYRFRTALAFADKNREVLWIFEIRDWQLWSQESLDLVSAWAVEHNVVLSIGRDATAAGAQ